MKHLRHRLRLLTRDLTGYDFHIYDPDRQYNQFTDAVALLGAASPITAFDVGANKGQTIDALTSAFPNATIHAFEPSPQTFAQLAPLASNRIRLNQCGVGSAAGELEFNENDQSALSSFLPLGPGGWGSITGTVKVPVTTIDEYASKNRIDHIHLLKIDTQGFDLEVIKGASKMMDEGRISLMLTEITIDGLYLGLPRFDEIYGFMADRGYVLTGFYDMKRRGRILGWFDAMFASPQLARSAYESAAIHI